MPAGADILRRITISDVATAAGVSRTTVSYVLSGREDARVPDATRRRVLDAAEKVGYRRNALAVAFRSGRMNTVGIVAPISLTEGQAGVSGGVYYKELVLALAVAGFAAGLNPLLLSENSSRQVTLADITDRRADGVILVVKENASAFVAAADAAGVPCVTVGRNVGGWQVHADNLFGARLAVEHLIARGHRRIAHFWYGHESVASATQRRDGFARTMADAGRCAEEMPIFTDKQPGDLVRALLRPDGPTAVFAYNDELAVQVVDLCHAHGLSVPGDVSVVGFDDNILALASRPRLTSVHSPIEHVSTRAVELLLRQLNGEPAPEPVLCSPWLVVRESTGPPRKTHPTQPRPKSAILNGDNPS
jgi:LacI family transcriptional regulator